MIAAPDLEGIRTFLDRHCGTELDLDKLEISYLKLSVDGPVLATLEVDSQASEKVAIGARWMSSAKGHRWAERLNATWSGGPTGAGDAAALYAPDLEILFTVFPFDRRLTGLPHALDSEVMAGRLGSLLAPVTNPAAVADLHIEPIRYKPDGKCVIRYDIRWEGSNSHAPQSVYGKVSKPSIFGRSKRTHDAVIAIGRHTDFVTPRALGSMVDLGLEIFSELPGQPMADLVARPEFRGLGRRVGAALRSLHELRLDVGRSCTVDQRIELVTDNADQLCSYRPEVSGRVGAVTGQIALLMGRPPAGVAVVAHNDFHAGNILIDGPDIGLVDFEDLAMADPAEDLGAMYAHLTELAGTCPSQAASIKIERSEFIDAYGGRQFGERMTAHAAMSCLLRSYQALRHPGEGSSVRSDLMLRAAEEVLEGATP